MPATRGLEKHSDRAITPAAETVHVPAHLAPSGSPQANQLCHLHTQNSHWGRAATGEKSIAPMRTGSLWSCLTLWPCRLRPASLLCQGQGISKHEYWSILASTGCHTLQFSSVAQLCPTLCNPMNRSTPGLLVHHQLPEFTETHVH